ncbi:hypothetical protein H6G33_17815 [Calothrix sp. FACHB-1219]|uniref:hypothetical protein n=1 Tax=unclassified Calothrix TaxID=2619626 RepID=UPI00168975FC|nr:MULTISPECIES: hypothetical protein [unclassified Calothrix]MBD2202736.1 hypothetical protein [Calothrix sp. FACHB-168]MBD2218889.1 hypothetical protein [Calothrix sp. FACHB-1219]
MTNLENIPQPDPSWDYYQIWNSLLAIKSQMDRGLNLIAKVEKADSQIDEKLREILEPALNELEQIMEEDLSDYYSEESDA